MPSEYTADSNSLEHKLIRKPDFSQKRSIKPTFWQIASNKLRIDLTDFWILVGLQAEIANLFYFDLNSMLYSYS